MKQTLKGSKKNSPLAAKLRFSCLASQCHLSEKYMNMGFQANYSMVLMALPLPLSSAPAYRNSFLFSVGSYQ